jgi:hypothetical protein
MNNTNEIPTQPIPDHIAEACAWLSAAERHIDQPLRERLDAGDALDILTNVYPPYPPIDTTKPTASLTEVAPAITGALEQAIDDDASPEQKLRAARALGALRRSSP